MDPSASRRAYTHACEGRSRILGLQSLREEIRRIKINGWKVTRWRADLPAAEQKVDFGSSQIELMDRRSTKAEERILATIPLRFKISNRRPFKPQLEESKGQIETTTWENLLQIRPVQIVRQTSKDEIVNRGRGWAGQEQRYSGALNRTHNHIRPVCDIRCELD